MNQEKQEKITPLQNSEEHQKLVQELESQIKEKADKAEEWKNAYLKSELERKATEKALERTQEEKDDWKREAHASRKVYQETKQVKEQTDFLTELQKLQDQKKQLTK